MQGLRRRNVEAFSVRPGPCSAEEAEALVPVGRIRCVCFERLIVIARSDDDRIRLEVCVHEELKLVVLAEVRRDHCDTVLVRLDETEPVKDGLVLFDENIIHLDPNEQTEWFRSSQNNIPHGHAVTGVVPGHEVVRVQDEVLHLDELPEVLKRGD